MDEFEIQFEIGTNYKRKVDVSDWSNKSQHVILKAFFEVIFNSYCKNKGYNKELIFRYIDDDKKIISATIFYSQKLKSDFILFNFNNIPLIQSYYYTLCRCIYMNNVKDVTKVIDDIQEGFNNTEYKINFEKRLIEYSKVSIDTYYRSLAEWLAFVSLQFLFFHEVAHSFNGHIMFKSSPKYKEYISANKVDEEILLKTLEMDADAYAAGFLANFISHTNFKELEDAYPCLKTLKKSEIIDLCIYAIISTFICSGEYVVSKKSYLTPRMRAILCIDVLMKEFSNITDVEFDSEKCGRIIIAADINYTKIFKRKKISLGDIYKLMDEEESYRNELKSLWETSLRDSLSSFSLEELAK